MADLDFAIHGIDVAHHAVAPLLLFKLSLTNDQPACPVSNVMLQCQIRIEATRRSYGVEEKERLTELFGPPALWAQSLHGMLWTHATILVPPFEASCSVDIPVPCSFDFNVAATKYFAGLDNGEVPLVLLFSGSVFYQDGEGRLQIVQISHSKEASCRLPIAAWQSMMELYYPNSAWLRLGRAPFDRLDRFRRQHGLASWDQALEQLLDERVAEPAP